MPPAMEGARLSSGTAVPFHHLIGGLHPNSLKSHPISSSVSPFHQMEAKGPQGPGTPCDSPEENV